MLICVISLLPGDQAFSHILLVVILSCFISHDPMVEGLVVFLMP